MLKVNHNQFMIFLFCLAWQYSFQLTLKCDFEGQVVAGKRRGKINNILRRPFLPLCQKKYSVRGSLARQDRRWEKGEVRGLAWNAVPPAYLFVFSIPVVWGDSISLPAPLRLPRLHLKKLHVFDSWSKSNVKDDMTRHRGSHRRHVLANSGRNWYSWGVSNKWFFCEERLVQVSYAKRARD